SAAALVVTPSKFWRILLRGAAGKLGRDSSLEGPALLGMPFDAARTGGVVAPSLFPQRPTPGASTSSFVLAARDC
ncbi:MAG: hypothetical protein SFV23_25900, partial [Planctomycetaceae bacterium]|nr:hypothetical protein [Planctomycetaceae bacterium]